MEPLEPQLQKLFEIMYWKFSRNMDELFMYIE